MCEALFGWLKPVTLPACLFILVLIPLTQGSVNPQVLAQRQGASGSDRWGQLSKRVAEVIKQIACNQLCSPRPGLKQQLGFLHLLG